MSSTNTLTLSPQPANIIPPPHPLAFVDSNVDALFLLQQARYSELQIQQLRQGIQDGSISISLPPPAPTGLPPLPGIPNAQLHHHQLAEEGPGSSKTRLPVRRPPFGTQTPLSEHKTVEGLVDDFNTRQKIGGPDANGASVSYSKKRRSLYIKLGVDSDSSDLTAEIKALRDDGTEEDGADAQKAVIRRVISSGNQSVTVHNLAKHLTDLELSVPELLMRLPHLLRLSTSTCLFCQKRLHPTDGLPVGGIGWLADPPQRRRRRPDGKDVGKAETTSDPERGQGGSWVCWHPGCEPAQ